MISVLGTTRVRKFSPNMIAFGQYVYTAIGRYRDNVKKNDKRVMVPIDTYCAQCDWFARVSIDTRCLVEKVRKGIDRYLSRNSIALQRHRSIAIAQCARVVRASINMFDRYICL